VLLLTFKKTDEPMTKLDPNTEAAWTADNCAADLTSFEINVISGEHRL